MQHSIFVTWQYDFLYSEYKRLPPFGMITHTMLNQCKVRCHKFKMFSGHCQHLEMGAILLMYNTFKYFGHEYCLDLFINLFQTFVLFVNRVLKQKEAASNMCNLVGHNNILSVSRMTLLKQPDPQESSFSFLQKKSFSIINQFLAK